MRILHCSDFHGNAAWFDWLAESAANYDLVCLAGDHIDLLNLPRINTQLKMVQAELGRVAAPLALCSGNNDAFGGPPAPACLLHATWITELRRPGLWVDGDVFTIGRLRIRCIGWNAQLPAACGDEIWLCHAPPARSHVAMDSSGGDAGDEILGERCRAGAGPAALLTGHQHDPIRWACHVGQTWCFNPGYNSRSSEPNHIILDTTQLTAELVSGGRSVDMVNLGYPA